MSIRLYVEANDAEVENLLAYLALQSDLGNHDKIYLLERTVKWLRAVDESTYSLTSGDPRDSFRLGIDSTAPLSLQHSGMPAQPPEEEAFSQECRK